MIHDFKCEKAEDIYNKDLAEGVRHFKETEEGRDEMKDPVEAYAEKRERIGKREGKREGERKTLIQNIKSELKLIARINHFFCGTLVICIIMMVSIRFKNKSYVTVILSLVVIAVY